MKLFVDDLRTCPEGWELARTVTEAIRILATMQVDEISLDHDISTVNTETGVMTSETFEAVAWYIKTMENKPKIFFHTGNTQAGKNMARIIGCPYARYNYKEEATK